MRPGKFFSVVVLTMCCLFMTPMALTAQEGGETSGSGESNPLVEGLMSILQQSIDEFIGNYKGRLGEVKLLERRGNRLVLEVTYDNVKRSDNVYVQGEVLHLGSTLEGFSNNLSAISGSRGKARLAIGWQPQGDDGWGTSVGQVESDQVRLYLVRGSNPDRPFGQIVYDLTKAWTDNDELDEEAMVADSGAIELEEEPAAEGSGATTTRPGPSIFVKPGTVLKPHQPGATVRTPQQTNPQQSVPQTGTVQTQTPAKPSAPVLSAPVTTARPMTAVIKGVEQYEFYADAAKAQWRSGAGTLPFPGSAADRRGFARKIAKGTLNSGHNAIQLLQTHPQFKSDGWIAGVFPAMILGKQVRFQSVVGFLKGANRSDGAVFQVYVKENNTYQRVANAKVMAKGYARIDADLSRWAGKKIQLILRVNSSRSSTQDWAIWVKPRLRKQQ